MEFVVVTEPRDHLPLAGEFAGTSADLRGVRWEQEYAVVVDMGEQRTGGYGVTVAGVRVASGVAHLDLTVRRPGPGQMVTQVITHPVAVARVPRAAALVVVRDQAGRELAQLRPAL